MCPDLVALLSVLVEALSVCCSCHRVKTPALCLLQAYCPLAQGTKLSDPELVKLAEKVGRTPAQVCSSSSRAHGTIR
jgi:hypothetical protein